MSDRRDGVTEEGEEAGNESREGSAVGELGAISEENESQEPSRYSLHGRRLQEVDDLREAQ